MKELWTHVECGCGRVAAIPELGYWPICGNCGERMVAPTGPTRVVHVVEPMPLEQGLAEVERRRGERVIEHATMIRSPWARRYTDEEIAEVQARAAA